MDEAESLSAGNGYEISVRTDAQVQIEQVNFLHLLRFSLSALRYPYYSCFSSHFP